MHGLFHFPAPTQKLKEFLNETNFLCFLKTIYPLEFPIYWNEASFDLLSQIFAPFGKILILIQKKPLCIFQPQAQNKKKLLHFFKKQNSYIFEWMLTKRKISYIPLYSGITADLAYLVKFLNQGETWKIPKQT